MDIPVIFEKAGTGTLNASRATTATITDMKYLTFMARSPLIVVAVAF